MTEATDPATAVAPPGRSRSALARTFGVRLFYHPGSRRRLALIAAGGAVVFYVVRGVLQFALLRHSSLQYDYKPFFDAATTLNQGGDPYTVFLETCGRVWCHVGYIYTPLFAELFRPLALLEPYTGARLWLLASHLLVLGTIIVVQRTVGQWLSVTAQAFLLAAALLFLPLYQNLWFLQVGGLLAFILALAAWAFVGNRRDGLAGAAIGLAGVLRLTPLVLAPMLVRGRRQLYRPAGFAGLVFSVVGLLGVLELLTPTTGEFLTTVLPRIGVSTPALDNQSLPGLLLRIEALLNTGHVPVAVASLSLQLAIVAITWIACLGVESGRGRAAVFAAFLAAMPIVSSITWDHHLMLELLVFALLAPSLVSDRRSWRLALAAYPLLWVNRGLTDPLARLLGLDSPHGLSVAPFLVVTSLNLAGMLLLWVACLTVLARRGFDEPSPGAAPASTPG